MHRTLQPSPLRFPSVDGLMPPFAYNHTNGRVTKGGRAGRGNDREAWPWVEAGRGWGWGKERHKTGGGGGG